jgi:hypothetical protein
MKWDPAGGAVLAERRRENIMPTKPTTATRRTAAATLRPMTAPLRGFSSNEISGVAESLELEPFIAAREPPAAAFPELVVHVELEKTA